MVATAFPCDREDVSVIRLSEPRVRPHGDRIVALEVAEDPSAGFSRAMEPGAFAAPDKGVALARVALDPRVLRLLRRSSGTGLISVRRTANQVNFGAINCENGAW